MLRDAGVRTKLLAVLAIPTLLLLLVTGLLVAEQAAKARQAGQVTELTDVAIAANRVVHSLQDERSATLSHLEAPDAGSENRMQSLRRYTDEQVRALRSLLDASQLADISDAVSAALDRSRAGHDELAAARASIDAGRFFATEADVFYGRVIRADLDLPGVVAASGSGDLARSLQAYQALSTTIEHAAHERDLVEVALLTGRINESRFAQASARVVQQRQSLQDFQAKAPAASFARLDNALTRADNFAVDEVRRDLASLLEGRQPDFGSAVAWVQAANSRISALSATESLLVADIAQAATGTEQAQEQRALLLVLVAVLGLGLAAMLAIGLARRITRPLRRLTVAAGEIGDELPRMVERMQTPGEGPGVVVEPIAVESRDEIGKLAAAFNTVNDVTVQVAQEQAALRASIAEMFVNVARRNQVLLGRQLKALDEMEAREEDPDVLGRLFTLDHLATRMRRNAESLLVLAGIDSSRRLRHAMPLSDVVRTAVGEIEAYDRVDLSMAHDPDVSGRHALTVAHLLAELLENAAHFSNPNTRVVVSAVPGQEGVALTVTDYGIGMPEDEVAEANAKIAHPPVTDIAVSQRLGLFVVGRLAQRLGATVELRPGRSAGTVASVLLPVTVFEGMAITTVPDEVDHPVPAAPDVAADAEMQALETSLQHAVDEPVAVASADEAVAVASADEPEHAADEPAVERAEEVAEEGGTKQAPRRSRWSFSRRRGAPVVDLETVDPDDTVEAVAAAAEPEAAEPARAAPAEPAEPVDGEPVEAVTVEAATVEPEPAEPDFVAPVLASPGVEPDPVDPLPARQFAAALDVEPQPARPVEPEPAFLPEPGPAAFAAAVDILPARHGGGRFGRRGSLPRRGSQVTPAPHVSRHAAPLAPPTPTPDHVPVAGTDDTATAPGPLAARSGSAIDARNGSGLPDCPSEPAAATSQLPSGPPSEPAVPQRRTGPAGIGADSLTSLFASPVAPAPVAPAPVAPAPVAPAPVAPAPVVALELPSRSPVTATVPTALPPSEDLERLAVRSEMAATALSELRGLYEPSFTPAAAPPRPASGDIRSGGLSRRTPKATEAAATATPVAPPAPARERTATEVRGMLAGFRAGVERGRTTSAEAVASAASPATTDPTS